MAREDIRERQKMEYQDAEKDIRDSVIQIGNKYELGKKDVVAILEYLKHDILSLRESARLDGAEACPFWNFDHGCHYSMNATCHETPCKKGRFEK